MLLVVSEEGPFFQASDAVKTVRRNPGSENRNDTWIQPNNEARRFPSEKLCRDFWIKSAETIHRRGSKLK